MTDQDIVDGLRNTIANLREKIAEMEEGRGMLLAHIDALEHEIRILEARGE